MNEETESAIEAAAKDYRDRNRLHELPTVVLPDWFWDKITPEYAEDFKKRTGVTLARYDK